MASESVRVWDVARVLPGGGCCCCGVAVAVTSEGSTAIEAVAVAGSVSFCAGVRGGLCFRSGVESESESSSHAISSSGWSADAIEHIVSSRVCLLANSHGSCGVG